MKGTPTKSKLILLIMLGMVIFLAGTLRAQSPGVLQSILTNARSLIPARAQVNAAVEPKVFLPFVSTPPDVINDPVVFVSRKIPPRGSTYYTEGGSLPGVGPYSRFTVAEPGKLIVRYPFNHMKVLVDGSNPTAASLFLVDVNAPDVSYDGTQIVFAGLPQGNYQSRHGDNPGAWRIYAINVDGTNLRQITFSDRPNLSRFNAGNWRNYDDTDPAWLPDGRIVFSSTRWPSLGMYVDARTTNLYVVDTNGNSLHRITAERNGADRPMVDPLTGKIVYSRWWRNFRSGTNSMDTVLHPLGGYKMYNGLVGESNVGQLPGVPGADLSRNSWQLATINPDGTELAQWGGISGLASFAFDNQAYGGSFALDGSIYTNFFPMYNLGEAAGFGGIRLYPRGPGRYDEIIGITDENYQLLRQSPPSFHVFKGAYAAEPEVLPDGRLVISWAPNAKQDYGLYVINGNGSGLTKVYDVPGRTELQARVIRPRPLPPIIPDSVPTNASLQPPPAQGPYDTDGTFTFDALNVYFNAPVDVDIVNAIPVGSADTIRFFIDHQRSTGGNFTEFMDWPILLQELPVNPDGSVQAEAPANVPLFEQIRTSQQAGYDVPLTATNEQYGLNGAGHVAGLNFGRPGADQTCVGCHAGHTMIEVPANPADALWTNLAPGAVVSVSSGQSSRGLVDRKVNLGSGSNRHWAANSLNGQWALLVFPVPVSVRTVRLYDLPSYYNGQVNDATVRLYSDAAGTNQVASATSGAVSGSGTDVAFADITVRAIRIDLTSVSGSKAGLAEVEVIAKGVP